MHYCVLLSIFDLTYIIMVVHCYEYYVEKHQHL